MTGLPVRQEIWMDTVVAIQLSVPADTVVVFLVLHQLAFLPLGVLAGSLWHAWQRPRTSRGASRPPRARRSDTSSYQQRPLLL